jgi:hypothetical protein
MSLCKELLKVFEQFGTKNEESGEQIDLPTETDNIIDTEDGDISKVIMSNEEAEVNNAFKEDDAPEIKLSDVERVDPEATDFLNAGAPQESFIDRITKMNEVSSAAYGRALANRQMKSRLGLTKKDAPDIAYRASKVGAKKGHGEQAKVLAGALKQTQDVKKRLAGK